MFVLRATRHKVGAADQNTGSSEFISRLLYESLTRRKVGAIDQSTGSNDFILCFMKTYLGAIAMILL